MSYEVCIIPHEPGMVFVFGNPHTIAMIKRVLLCSVLMILPAGADFHYQSTSRMTGGSLLQMMRFVPGAGAMKEPQISTVAVQGNRMVRKSKNLAEIVDLDKRTITTINFDKHTYSEMTFEQMKQMLQDASDKMAQQQQGKDKVNLDLDADIKDTGMTKTVNGLEAHQVIVNMSMTASDPQSGQAGAMKMVSEMWLSKEVPGAAEMRDFYTHMAKELDWAPTGMGAMMNRPDIAKAMAKMQAEGGKMEGMPVQQIVRIGGDGTAGTAPAPAASRPSVSDALSGALGGFGGFGKKKKEAPADNTQTGGTAANGQAAGSLMEMTIDNTGFSTDAVDGSLFVVPGDFKKVEEAQPGRRTK
jgi:hypothetical protein